MEEYPSTAYVITLIGAIFSFIAGGIVSLVGVVSMLAGFGLGGICMVVGLLGGVLGLMGAFMMKNPEKVHDGGILAIIAAFLSIAGIISFILLLIGGIMALTWEKPKRKAVILPPPPPS